MANALACEKCGNTIASDRLRLEFDGNCPWCLAAFALDKPPHADPALELLIPNVKSSDRLGKYLLTEKLGTGGMGEVWKALDTELNRWVALKFLRDQDPKELARFAREAHMAAKLAHPNIAAVHEIGEVGGRHYIAMQCIEGRTLETFPKSDRRLLVRLCMDAARALDHAHRHGVIHRDVKPGNLMVEETEEGMKVVVLDFGLARSIEGGEKLSMSGSVVGTPQYLSPEQARAAQLDERTDVYSLGATMYEIFTGRTPFEGKNVYEILKKIENEEPVAPRKIKSQIPQDLQTIILKCLEKNRERRYAGAKELAYDLKRFLNHEAVLARPPSTIYYLRMTLAKRKAVVATAAIASVTLAAALGWWLLIGGPGAEHHRQMAAGMKLWDEARVSAVTRGDPAEIREKAKAARERFERAIQAREESEAHLMRGRCLELEGRLEEALKALERAYELNPGSAEIRVELAKALLLKYRASRGKPSLISFREGATPYIGGLASERPEERRWRERAEELLAKGETAPTQQALLKGLVALGRGDYDDAAKQLAIYTKAERWDAQALWLEAECRLYVLDFDSAIEACDRSLNLVPHLVGFLNRGKAKEAKGLYDEAIADYTRAIELDPKDANAFVNRGNAKYLKRNHDEAIADYTKAIDLDPKSGGAWTGRGNAKYRMRSYDEAIVDYTRAIELDPNSAVAWTGRGNAKEQKLQYDEAISDHTKAIELHPKWAGAYTGRGYANEGKGLYDESIADHTKAIGLDPKWAVARNGRGIANYRKGLYDEAIADYDKAIDLDPKDAMPFSNRGVAKDAKRLYDEAIADFTKAIERDPKCTFAYSNRATTKSAKGLYDQAIADCDEAIKLDPKFADAHYNRGNAKNAKGLYDEAIAEHTKAIELDPKHARAYHNRGIAYYGKGLLDEAIADYTKSIELNLPRLAIAYYNRGIARYDKRQFDEAIADYTKAIGLDSKYADAYGNRGNAQQVKGLFDEAIADYSKAIELNPGIAAAYINRGALRCDVKGLHDEAIADFDKAIQLDPTLAQAFLFRGIAKYRKGLRDDAIADFSKAINLNPKLMNAYFNRGTAQGAKGLHDEAIADFTKAIELDPKHAGAYCNRGAAKSSKGLHVEAIADFSKTIELDPKAALAYYNRGTSKSEIELYDEAIADLTKAIELDPKAPLAYLNRGRAYHGKGLHDDAIADYDKAVELDSKNASVYNNRGNAKFAKGLDDDAIEDYDKSIELDPKEALTYFNRGKARAGKGLYDEAVSDFRKALDVAPAGWPFRSTLQQRLDTVEAERPYQEANNLLKAKQYRKAIEKFKSVVEGHPKSRQAVDSAYGIACGSALLGEKRNALDWLEKAIKMGWDDVAHLEKDSDLESLRNEERYRQLVVKLKGR